MLNFTASKILISILLINLILFVHNVNAQQKNLIINSGELIKKASELHDKQEYKKAIDIYKQISRSDTNYSNALYELSLSTFTDKQLEPSLQYAKKGMELFPEDFARFGVQAANALDEMGKSEDALKIYDEALAKNPHAYLLYFNKGISLLKLKRNAEAKSNFQQCLLINPYYSSAHYHMGNIYLSEGNLVPSMLAYKTYLLITPEGKFLKNTVNNLDAIAKVTDEILGFVKAKKTSREDNFDMLQQIILSKIALDAQYKLQVKLEDKMVRQIQVVDEKLEYKSSDKGFAMQFYVPLYTMLYKDDFEPMIYSIFAGVTLEDVEKWRKKNGKALEKMSTKAVTYFNDIKTTRILQETDRKNAAIKYYHENGEFLGKGNFTTEKGKLLTTGNWEFYHSNGALKAKGNFLPTGEKQGEWSYYYSNSLLKEKSNFEKESLEGKTEAWYVNGNKKYTGTYSNNKVNGLLTNYYYNGLLLRKTNFINDKKDGAEEEYTSNGFLSYKAKYANDEKEGTVVFFHNNGQKQDELNYTKGKAQGRYKSYYKDGKVNTEGDYINDLKQGLWTILYPNGKFKEKTTYKDNEITGEFTEYYEDGKLSRKGNYTKKKIDGKLEYFSEDGLMYCDAVYDKGRLREIVFYDKKGNVLSNTSTRKGAADITFYSAEGIKTSQGFFNKDGTKEGEHLTYYASGKVSEKTFFKDGLQDGIHTTYYANGQINDENNFKEGVEDGQSKGFFSNGKSNYEGWVINDKKQQNILFYNLKGDIKTKNYYLNNELDGYSEYYYPGNVKDCDYRYHNGWLEEIIQFDTTGKVIVNTVLNKGKGALVLKHNNGKKYIECNYDNYEINGIYKSFYFDGTPLSVSYYENGSLDSNFKSFFYGGKLQTEGSYKNGEKIGTWKYYYDNGKISEEENYKEGKLSGEDRFYRRDGRVNKISHYKENQLDGEYTYYGDNDQLALIINYRKDEVVSYTYEDKAGKLVTPITLKGSTGKINGYYKNGTQSAELHLVNNSFQGAKKFFYCTGTPLFEGVTDIGYENGPKKMYYPNGKIETEETLELGNINGIRKTYYPNGKLQKEENFYNDDLHGICKYYEETGKLIQTRNYFYDNLLTAN